MVSLVGTISNSKGRQAVTWMGSQSRATSYFLLASSMVVIAAAEIRLLASYRGHRAVFPKTFPGHTRRSSSSTTTGPLRLAFAARGAAVNLRCTIGRLSRSITTVMSSPVSAAAAAASAPSAAGATASGGVMTLDTLAFDNAAIRELPVDPEPDNFVRSVPNACFSIVAPDPVKNPVLVAASSSALGLLGLVKDEAERDDVGEYFSGELHIPCTLVVPQLQTTVVLIVVQEYQT